MIYDLILRQRPPGLQRFLDNYPSKFYPFEETIQNKPTIHTNKEIGIYVPFHLMVDSKLRRNTQRYFGGKTSLANKLYSRRRSKKLDNSPIIMPHSRIKERKIWEGSPKNKRPHRITERVKYSSLFL